jgi:hypothetical protein
MFRIRFGFFFGLFFVFTGLGNLATLSLAPAMIGCCFLLTGMCVLYVVIVVGRDQGEQRSSLDKEASRVAGVPISSVPEPAPGHSRAGRRIEAQWATRTKKVSRRLSVLISLGYIVFVIVASGLHLGIFYVAGMLCLPLELIWFPDIIGKRKDYSVGWGWLSPSYVDQETPAVLIALAGWFFLVGLPIIIYLIWRS